MMSSPEIADILDKSRELDRLRKDQEDVLLEINKMHKKLQTSLTICGLQHGPKVGGRLCKLPNKALFVTKSKSKAPEVIEKPGDNSLTKLKGLYIQAKELSETEVTVSNTLLSQLDALLPSGPMGQQRRRIEGADQKRKRMKNDSDVSKLSPSMRNQLDTCASLKGEQVAARVTAENADKDEWFVVKVMHFDRETKEFEVLDEEPGDDEEGGMQRKYKLHMSCIIPFPKRNDPSIPEYPPGRHVLAVYPGTTALYKATVVSTPRKRKADDSYLLEFDDDEEDGALPQRTVPFHKVVPLPEGHRQ